MATQIAYFTGKAKWAKVFKPDDKFGDPVWSVMLYMDDANLENFYCTGMTMKPKTDDEGTFITFRRGQFKNIKNERVEFKPPEVVGPDGVTPFTDIIGNGSIVTIKVEYFDTFRGTKGSRLAKVRVDEHVPYITEAQETPVVPENTLPF